MKPGLLACHEEDVGGLVDGHGLLGGRDEVENDYLSRMADRHGWVLFATDWTGMCFDDAVSLINMLQNDRSQFPVVSDRLQQGFAEATVAAQLIQRGALADDPAMRTTDGAAAQVARQFRLSCELPAV